MPDNITPLDIAKRLAAGVTCGTCGGSGEEPHEFHIGSEDCDVCQRNIVNDCPTCNGEGVERYPQDGWPQLVHVKDVGTWCLQYYEQTDYERNLKRYGMTWYAAPHVTDAILWLLGTAAWRAKFGLGCGLLTQALARPCIIRGGTLVMFTGTGTLADLLRAMLEALT